MEVEQIFQDLQETGLINYLKNQKNLIFWGDYPPISYLKNSLLTTNNNCLFIDNYFSLYLLINNHKLTAYQGIVIISLQDENTIYSQIIKYLNQYQIQLPVLRLFKDLLTNLMSGNQSLVPSSLPRKQPRISYGILSLPRSGSTFFCSILRSTKIAGYPTEHLRKSSVTLAKNCNFNYLELLQNIMSYQVTSNGVFSTKLISHYLQDLQKTKFNFELLFKNLDKLIYLVRKDTLAQAISIVLAKKTQIWHIYQNPTQTKVSKELPQVYLKNLQQVKIDNNLLAEVKNIKDYFIKQQASYLQNLIASYKLSPLIVEYEKILENPQEQIKTILDFLDIKYSSAILFNLTCSFQKMTSPISQEIYNLYRHKYL